MSNICNYKIIKKNGSLNKKGYCQICNDNEEEPMYNLFGVEICEGCYYDLINHMGYKNLDDLLDCDKKQLSKFLNILIGRK